MLMTLSAQDAWHDLPTSPSADSPVSPPSLLNLCIYSLGRCTAPPGRLAPVAEAEGDGDHGEWDGEGDGAEQRDERAMDERLALLPYEVKDHLLHFFMAEGLLSTANFKVSLLPSLCSVFCALCSVLWCSRFSALSR